jgi:hypothetical protein
MSFVVVVGVAACLVVALGATSTRWFCDAGICHKVQTDTIEAYRASSHSRISCMACHEPVNADPLTFVFAKAKMGLGLIPTFGNTFELPLNPGSALALKGGREMGSQQCTQCHSANRVVTTSKGIIIDHKAHADAGVWCTLCHNRIAHDDTAAPPQLIAPNGAPNTTHPDFMKMDACFRCHDLEGRTKMTGIGAKAAPGACATCHPAGFDLVPESHKAARWAVSVHGEKAKEMLKELGVAEVEAKDLESEGIVPYLAAPVNECFTCHSESEFCKPCHDKLRVTASK